jgi:phosphatidylglycerophosphate synthase
MSQSHDTSSDSAGDVAPHPTPTTPSGWNYFARDEQPLQAGFRARRDRWLRPLVNWLLGRGITAEHASLASALLLVPVALVVWMPNSLLAQLGSVACLWGHVLIDGLDGPLARASGTAGPRGAFTDMCLDHLGFLTLTAVCVAADLMDGVAGVLYASTYMVVLVVALNLLGRSPRFVLRTKYITYLLFSLAVLAQWNILTPAAYVFSGIHALLGVAAFVATRRLLP